MHARTLTFLVIGAALLLPAAAAADVPHVVEPGETLTSIAATDGLTVAALAAANNLSPTAQLQIGQIIEIPPQTSSTTTPSPTATTTPSPTPTPTPSTPRTGGTSLVPQSTTQTTTTLSPPPAAS